MGLLIFSVKRFLSAIVVLFAVSVLTFLIFFAIPNGNPALRLAGRTARPSDIARVERIYGFNKPLWVQYWRVMKQIFDGSIQSYAQRTSVFGQIERGLPATASLAIGGAILWLLVGVVFGVIGAMRAGKATDVAISTFSFIGISAPSFVVGSILLYVFAFKIEIFPNTGYVAFSASPLEWFQHLVLPWITLALLYIGIYAQVLRSGVLDAMTADNVRTAYAKGLSPNRVIIRHVLRVSLIPIVSLWGLDFAAVLGGSTIVVENVFNLQGVGQYIATSVGQLDVPPILVTTLFGAFFVVLMNAIVDVLYAFLDPRIRGGSMSARRTILTVEKLGVRFRTEQGVVQAVDDVSFTLAEGEVLSIVGESGSGKSVTAMTLMGLTRSPNTEVEGSAKLADGTELITATTKQLQRIRGSRIAMIFQDPMSALTPVYRIGDQIVEQIRAHEKVSRQAARARSIELLGRVGIPRPADRARSYPHEFSGGMRQRVMIAMALSCSPEILIADEPTTALDVTIQAQILDEIEDLRRETGVGVLLITHDLGVVAEVANRVIVLYAGRIREQAELRELFKDPMDPYTWGLLGSIPRVDQDRPTRLPTISGSPPSLINPPKGCHFITRCPHNIPSCTEEPALHASDPANPRHLDRCVLDLDHKRAARTVNGAFGLPAMPGTQAAAASA